MNYIHNHCDDYGIDEEDEALMRSDMEQKCWIGDYKNDAKIEMLGLIMDINPTEIISHIESENLRSWCESWQASAQSGCCDDVEGMKVK